MKVHERIIQEISTPSQKLNQSPKRDDFKIQLEKALGLQRTEEKNTDLSQETEKILSLAEEIIDLLEAASKGQKEAFWGLEKRAQELSQASKNFTGAARHFLEELSLTAVISAAKAQEGFI